MDLSPRNHVSTEQMDGEIRPYYIHHRNQAGINTSLMDLFRLIDLFLREDEDAREPLQALRLVSDYLQRKQVVAPIPAELVNFYDDPREAIQPHDPLHELSNLLASVSRPSGQPAVEQQARDMPSPPRVPKSKKSHKSQQDSIFGVPLGMPSTSQPGRVDLALAFGDMPVPQPNHSQSLPSRASPSMAATDHRRALVIEVIRERLRLWLRRPDTSALKKWVLRKGHSTENTSWQFVPSPQVRQWPEEAHSVHEHGSVATHDISDETYDGHSNAFPNDGIHVTQDIVMYRDSLPPARRRSLSASINRPLPSLPVQGQAYSIKSGPSYGAFGGHEHTRATSRSRSNSFAFPSPFSDSTDTKPGEVAHPPAAKNPLRSRRPSLKDRAISALFSKKAEPLTASTSLQAHSNDTRIQPAKVTAPGRAPSSKRKGPPSLQAENPVSTTLTSLATTTNKYQQPQPSNSDVDVSSIPSITVQPPSITGTLSGASTPRPNKRSSSKSAQERTLSAGSRHTTVYSVKGQNTHTATNLGRERTSERDSRGSFRTVRYPDESDSIVIIESPQSMTTGIPWNTEGISRHECESPLNVHHGLPTPKSVWNRAQLPLKLSTNSLHENRTPSHSHSKPDFRNAEPMESHVPHLTSRFSLDSHFTASSESYDGGHSTSPGSEHHLSSSGEALSQEGAFLARLASRRKRPIRSGVSKPARTTNSRLNEDQWVGGFAPKPPAKPKERSSRTIDNAGYDPPPYQTTHRRILSH